MFKAKLIFIAFLAVTQAAWAGYPKIMQLKGKVQYSTEQEAPKALIKNQVLKDKATILVPDKASCLIALASDVDLVLGADTQVNFPLIDSSGEVRRFTLLHGSMRLLNQSKSNFMIETQVTLTDFSAGDYLLQFDPDQATVGLVVVKGQVQFGGLENEEQVIVKSGQQTKFSGVIENGAPAFDILLKGKKVAKGELSPVTAIVDAELDKLTKPFQQAAAMPKVKVVKQMDPESICKDPEARFNQCAWTCENNRKKAKVCEVQRQGVHCVRRRCNGEGEWSDAFTLPSGQSVCGAKPIVGSCPY